MSRIADAVQELYDLSIPPYDQEYTDNIIAEITESCANAGNFYLLNNILYNINLNKLYIEVAGLLVYYTYDHAHDLSMRQQFIEMCREHYQGHPKRQELFCGKRSGKP